MSFTLMNQSFIHADIFFFVTTILAIVLGVLLAIVLAYTIKILRDIDRFQKKVSQGTGEIIEDIKVIKNDIINEGGGLSYFAKLLFRTFGKTIRRVRRHRSKL